MPTVSHGLVNFAKGRYFGVFLKKVPEKLQAPQILAPPLPDEAGLARIILGGEEEGGGGA